MKQLKCFQKNTKDRPKQKLTVLLIDTEKVKVSQEPLTCCKVCWVRLSSSGHSLCQPDGTWPGCSSHPISGISSCKGKKKQWEENDGHAPSTHPPLQRTDSSTGRRVTRFNLGLNVPQFSLRLHILGLHRQKGPWMSSPQFVADDCQEVTWHLLLLCQGNPGLSERYGWYKLWVNRVKSETAVSFDTIVFSGVDFCSTYPETHLFLIPTIVPFSSGE